MKQAPSFRVARPATPVIAVDGVPEHRQHEPALPLERPAPKELRTVGDEDVGLERRLKAIGHS